MPVLWRRLLFIAFALSLSPIPGATAKCTPNDTAESPTCWKPIGLAPAVVATIEISRKSISQIDAMIPEFRVAGKHAVARIRDVLHDHDLQSVGIVVTIDAYHQIHHNADCSIYKKNRDGAFVDRISPSLTFEEDCSEAVKHLLLAVTRVEDFVHTLGGARESVNFADDPDWSTLTAYARETQFVKTSLAESLHGSADFSPEELDELSELENPQEGLFYRTVYARGFTYTVREKDTLWDISRSFSGHGVNYGAIVAISEFDETGTMPIGKSVYSSVDDPNIIYAGDNVKVPLRPADWIRRSVSHRTKAEVAEQLYNSVDFVDLIERICDVSEVEKVCWLPLFHDPERLAAALYSATTMNPGGG